MALEQCNEAGAECGQECEVDERVERHDHVGAHERQVAQWREDGHWNDVQRREKEKRVRERRAEYELKLEESRKAGNSTESIALGNVPQHQLN